MRGWRRLGVVLSVLWLVGFGWWLWTKTVTNSVASYSDYYKLMLRDCIVLSEIKRDDPDYDKTKIDSEQETCSREAAVIHERLIAEAYAEVWVLAAVDAGALALLWLLAWMIVVGGRWTAAGFRQQT
jgi:hypothetical protein